MRMPAPELSDVLVESSFFNGKQSQWCTVLRIEKKLSGLKLTLRN